METYKNLGRDSGVIGYDLGDGEITVYFKGNSGYVYTNASAGSHNISQMQKLAVAGQGLGTFINTTVKKLYARKL